MGKVVKLTEENLNNIVKQTVNELMGIGTPENFRQMYDKKRSLTFHDWQIKKLLRIYDEAITKGDKPKAEHIVRVNISAMLDIMGETLDNIFNKFKEKYLI